MNLPGTSPPHQGTGTLFRHTLSQNPQLLPAGMHWFKHSSQTMERSFLGACRSCWAGRSMTKKCTPAKKLPAITQQTIINTSRASGDFSVCGAVNDTESASLPPGWRGGHILSDDQWPRARLRDCR